VSRAEVRDFLGRHGLMARKDLGQNFLADAGLAQRLAGLAGVAAGDSVIEVGTGTGVLTRALAARAERVVTLDVDAGLVRALRSEGALPANVELRHEDVLRADLRGIAAGLPPPVRLVSNLPYSISGPALRRLLDLRDLLADWSVMLQREVGERLLAAPGSRAYGSLTVLHAVCARIERRAEVPPGRFFPAPQVRSVFLRITPRADAPLAPGELPGLERCVRAAFGSRRKTLENALLRGASRASPAGEAVRGALVAAGIDPRARAETVAPERFLDLARALGETGAAGRP
jgi:16S rRNA (adenine1518-N6/adenine1519-N6)-dimethyltransferase